MRERRRRNKEKRIFIAMGWQMQVNDRCNTLTHLIFSCADEPVQLKVKSGLRIWRTCASSRRTISYIEKEPVFSSSAFVYFLCSHRRKIRIFVCFKIETRIPLSYAQDSKDTNIDHWSWKNPCRSNLWIFGELCSEVSKHTVSFEIYQE